MHGSCSIFACRLNGSGRHNGRRDDEDCLQMVCRDIWSRRQVRLVMRGAVWPEMEGERGGGGGGRAFRSRSLS